MAASLNQVAATTDDPHVRSWERFFKTAQRHGRHEESSESYRAHIHAVALGYPQRRSVVVDYWDLDRHDQTLSTFILDNPIQCLRLAEEALKAIDLPMDVRPRMRVRVDNLPDHVHVDVRELRAEHLGRLVAVKGLIKKASEVRPRIQEAVYRCQRCGALIRQPQEEHLVLKDPLDCYEDQGGCGRQTSWKLILDPHDAPQMSSFVDTQRLELQESPENMRGGEQPQRLNLFGEEDLCGVTQPGDRLVVNGVLRSAVRKANGVKSTIFDLFLDVISLEREQEEFEEVEITPDEEEEIRRASRDPELFDKLTRSIAPSIYGMEWEKQSLILQLFGGLEKKLPDGTKLRGDIHVLLVGDPGVAKSQLIRYMSKLAPRGIYTSGKASSGAGLTAAAVKDEFGDGRWTLEAGAMVLADRGLLCVDEIDKMDKQDQSSMHEGMEQQTISVAKAGIQASLQSRCSVLGAANPKHGRFDEHSPLTDQIDFPPALLSRFDLIFVLLDRPNPEHDGRLAGHILNVHRGGAMHMQVENIPDSLFTSEDVAGTLTVVEPPISKDFLRKYVAYSKRHCYPVLSDEARDKIRDYYVNLRRQASAEEGGPVPLTARQLEAIVRLAEASAKVRISDIVEEQDAARAINTIEYYMKKIGGSEGGIMDIDIIASGTSHNQRETFKKVKGIIRDLSAGSQEGADKDEILAEAVRAGVDRQKAIDAIRKLKQNGELFEPRPDVYRFA